MSIRIRRVPQFVIGAAAVGGVTMLLAWDLRPGLFPARAHDFLAAFPLAMIACAILLHELIGSPDRSEFVKALMLAAAFLFWSANQLWPTLRQSTLFNDIAIALFVFDAILVIFARPVRVS